MLKESTEETVKPKSLKQQLLLAISALVLIAIVVQSGYAYYSLTVAYDQVTRQTRDQFDDLIKDEVKSVINDLQIDYDRFKNSEISEAQARAEAEKIVRNSRYDNSEGAQKGYFWADDATGKCVIHPNTSYEGLERYDYKDERGNYYIRNLIAAGNKTGGGFTDFWFTKLGKDGTFQKRGYTAKFEPYGWYISTGNYTEDMDAIFNQCKNEKTRSLATTIGIGIAEFLLCLWIAKKTAEKVTRPLQEITERLRLLSKGDFTSPVPKENESEETLFLSRAAADTVNAFNGMVTDLKTNMEKMANGDFRIQITSDYPGDMAPVRQAIETIAASLDKTIRRIAEASDQVFSGANQLSNGAQSLSEGATEQASSVQELAEIVGKVADHVKQNAEDAENADTVSHQMGKEVQNSSGSMTKLVEAISEISTSSSKISKIIKTIDDIAFQTNILALNAAVEASRAGEAGKGFAVVADEVRSLANRSAEAAKGSAVLIENSVHAVEKGTKMAGEANDSLNAVFQDASQVISLVNGISASSKKQADSVIQIHQGIEQISSVVQTVSATAEESAAASKELDNQASVLRGLVSHFQFNEETIQ